MENTVPIQNDFPTNEKQECDRSEPQFRGSSIPQARRRLHRVPALLAEQKNRY